MAHPINILERYWGHTSFRPLQEEIIQSVLDRNDTFALLPTGGGKSVCFQIPALINEGICIVISPLIALMKDQVNTLKQKGIKAMAITSGISYQELDTLLDNCIYGNYKFLYLSPERLQQDLVQHRIQQMNVNLIAVDEAHCISQWGNDFRPAYRQILVLRQLHPSVPVIGLTATAKPNVVDDIVAELDFMSPKIFKASFNRPNIAYQVLDSEDKAYDLGRILKKHHGSSIIYVRSRRLSIDIHHQLEKIGFSSTFFHGGINNEEKQQRLDAWMNNQKQIMVATNAFGMGIDKPDVRTVIHINLPESLESYYQEAGRAGRDGKPSFAIILKNNSDIQLLKNQFLKNLPTLEDIKLIYRKLCNYFQISYGEGELTTYQFNFNDFCKTYEFNTNMCFNTLRILDQNSILKLSQQFNFQTKVKIIIPNAALFNYLDSNPSVVTVVKGILRTYGGVFDHLLAINPTLIADKSNISVKAVIGILKKLAQEEIIELQHSNTDSEIVLLQPREDDKTINRIANIVEQQQELTRSDVFSVIDYVENKTICRKIQLLNYFGESVEIPCGTCSVCLKNVPSKEKKDKKEIRKQVILALENGPLNSRGLLELLRLEEQAILPILKELLELDIIEVTFANTYKLKHT